VGHFPGTNLLPMWEMIVSGTFYRHVCNRKLQKVPTSFIIICLLAYNNLVPDQWIFIKFYIGMSYIHKPTICSCTSFHQNWQARSCGPTDLFLWFTFLILGPDNLLGGILDGVSKLLQNTVAINLWNQIRLGTHVRQKEIHVKRSTKETVQM
jgi:hypothetical protein